MVYWDANFRPAPAIVRTIVKLEEDIESMYRSFDSASRTLCTGPPRPGGDLIPPFSADDLSTIRGFLSLHLPFPPVEPGADTLSFHLCLASLCAEYRLLVPLNTALIHAALAAIACGAVPRAPGDSLPLVAAVRGIQEARHYRKPWIAGPDVLDSDLYVRARAHVAASVCRHCAALSAREVQRATTGEAGGEVLANRWRARAGSMASMRVAVGAAWREEWGRAFRGLMWTAGLGAACVSRDLGWEPQWGGRPNALLEEVLRRCAASDPPRASADLLALADFAIVPRSPADIARAVADLPSKVPAVTLLYATACAMAVASRRAAASNGVPDAAPGWLDMLQDVRMAALGAGYKREAADAACAIWALEEEAGSGTGVGGFGLDVVVATLLERQETIWVLCDAKNISDKRALAHLAKLVLSIEARPRAAREAMHLLSKKGVGIYPPDDVQIYGAVETEALLRLERVEEAVGLYRFGGRDKGRLGLIARCMIRQGNIAALTWRYFSVTEHAVIDEAVEQEQEKIAQEQEIIAQEEAQATLLLAQEKTRRTPSKRRDVERTDESARKRGRTDEEAAAKIASREKEERLASEMAIREKEWKEAEVRLAARTTDRKQREEERAEIERDKVSEQERKETAKKASRMAKLQRVMDENEARARSQAEIWSKRQAEEERIAKEQKEHIAKEEEECIAKEEEERIAKEEEKRIAKEEEKRISKEEEEEETARRMQEKARVEQEEKERREEREVEKARRAKEKEDIAIQKAKLLNELRDRLTKEAEEKEAAENEKRRTNDFMAQVRLERENKRRAAEERALKEAEAAKAKEKKEKEEKRAEEEARVEAEQEKERLAKVQIQKNELLAMEAANDEKEREQERKTEEARAKAQLEEEKRLNREATVRLQQEEEGCLAREATRQLQEEKDYLAREVVETARRLQEDADRLAREAVETVKAKEKLERERLAEEARAKAQVEEEERLAREKAEAARRLQEERQAEEASAKAQLEEEEGLAREAAEAARRLQEERQAEEARAKAQLEEKEHLVQKAARKLQEEKELLVREAVEATRLKEEHERERQAEEARAKVQLEEEEEESLAREAAETARLHEEHEQKRWAEEARAKAQLEEEERLARVVVEATRLQEEHEQKRQA
eukprot:CAMPEP_0194267038 /NCGR_PEP_ID=MMETSP0169-20130528/1716_1 /TAXON_ID=218684 /ORGANISM="Corethron pennatum, Strain L29A3" /LENGTH=1139 /DNA_ID=CAMNT_0039007835 /DNA_START=217 /DNA_END=3632 /DNA_ORIENTATION=-